MTKNVLQELSDAFAAAVEQAGGYTVMVAGRRRMPASGILVEADLVLTAEHVLERNDEIGVGLPDGNLLRGKVAGRDRGTDLAVVRLEQPAGIPAELSRIVTRPGMLAPAVARPGAGGVQASLGFIQAVHGPLRFGRGALLEQSIHSDAAALPGFSGGPLVDSEGRMLGINTSGLVPGMLLTIPAEMALGIAGQLSKSGRVKRGYLGVRSQTVELPEAAQAELGRPQKLGLLVVRLESDGSAAKGGLLVGDILVGAAGKPVEDHDDLTAGLSGESVGRQVEFEVLRGGKRAILALMIVERP